MQKVHKRPILKAFRPLFNPFKPLLPVGRGFLEITTDLAIVVKTMVNKYIFYLTYPTSDESALTYRLDASLTVLLVHNHRNIAMTTYSYDDLYAIQIEHEQEMLDKGISKYRKNVQAAKDRGEESSTNYGNLLMKQSIDSMTKALDKYLLDSLTGDAGTHATAAKILSTLDIEVCSYIALKVVVNSITNRITLTKVCVAIGQAIHDQHLCDKFKGHNKLWFKSTMDFMAKRKASRHHKKMTLRTAADKANTHYNTWTTQEIYHIGAKLVDLVIETTGMVFIESVTLNNKRKANYLSATPEILDWIREINNMSEALTPEALPFVIPPKDWKTVNTDVTHSNLWVKRFSLIKTRNKALLEELDGEPDLQPTIDAVNVLQRTPFKINKRIVEIQRQCWEAGQGWGGIPMRDPLPMPPSPFPDMPVHEMDEEQKKILWKHKKKCQAIHEKNASSLSKKIAFERSLQVAERFAKFPELFFIYQCDYRGRIYPVAQFLSPQGNSLIKAQMLLANGKPIDTYEELKWLYHHAANCFGWDKETIDNRVSNIEEMLPEIKRIAEDPYTHASWVDADDPWNFLAACFEIAEFHKVGYGFISHISIALDATNSGLQIYSALLRDPVGAKATNVLPNEKPADVYRDVAEATEARLAVAATGQGEEAEWAKIWLEFGIDRKLTKTPTMTLVYSATLFSCRDYVRDELIERFELGKAVNPFGDDEDSFIRGTFYLAKVIWESIGDCVKAARTCMDWMQQIARDVSKLHIPMIWTAPSGFKVVQSYPEMKSLRIQTHIDGQLMRPRLNVPKEGKVDKKRAASGICPNFIHAIDSSFLVLTVLRCMKDGVSDLWMIHDSFGTTSKGAEILSNAIREEYKTMFESNNILEEFRQAMLENIDKVDPPPEQGELDLGEVVNSKYFFS